MIYKRDEIQGFTVAQLETFAFICGVSITTEIILKRGSEWIWFEISAKLQSRIDCFLDKIGYGV